jgi:hypothetical protein
MARTDQHLIVIRGNTASGKTSLARELQVALGRGTANIGQDHFRRVVLREHDVRGGDNIELIALAARHCLQIGYHVILEGILFSEHYGGMLRALLDEQAGPRHVFYLDVPLEESLRRHKRGPLGAEVTKAQIRSWYVDADHLGVAGEVVVPSGLGLEDLLHELRASIGYVLPLPVRTKQRFL